MSVLRAYDLRLRQGQCNAEIFLQDLQEGKYKNLSLNTLALPKDSAIRSGASRMVSGHLHPPHFAFDPDVGSLLLKGLAQDVSAWDIYDFLVECPGFCTAAWTRVGNTSSSLRRDFHARFATTSEATSALGTMTQEFENKFGQSLEAMVLNASPVTAQKDIRAIVLPPEMSSPERLAKDANLSARIIKCLDSLQGVRPEVTDAILSHDAPVESKQDVQVAYLRRVHHFCFYSAAWFEDEWSLRNQSGGTVLREGIGDGLLPSAEGRWAKAHEQRLEAFLTAVELTRPEVLSSHDPNLVTQILDEQTLKIREDKLQCKLCQKCFKGSSYIHKHLKRNHPSLLSSALLQSAASDAFFADPARPMGLQHRQADAL